MNDTMDQMQYYYGKVFDHRGVNKEGGGAIPLVLRKLLRPLIELNSYVKNITNVLI